MSPLDEHSRPFCGVSPEHSYVADLFTRQHTGRGAALRCLPQKCYASALCRRRNNNITHRIKTARGHHKRTGRSLTAVQGRLRSSPLPLKVPPSDPPPLSPSPLSNRAESNANTRIPCYPTNQSQSLRGRGRLSMQ